MTLPAAVRTGATVAGEMSRGQGGATGAPWIGPGVNQSDFRPRADRKSFPVTSTDRVEPEMRTLVTRPPSAPNPFRESTVTAWRLPTPNALAMVEPATVTDQLA